MIRIANDRISDLFGLAEVEARRGRFPLAHRYVALARRIGTRYNVRLLPEYRDVYCRACSSYWVEGRTVQTRLRRGRRLRRCLSCGHTRRTLVHTARAPGSLPETDRTVGRPEEPALVEDLSPAETDLDADEGQDE